MQLVLNLLDLVANHFKTKEDQVFLQNDTRAIKETHLILTNSDPYP